MEQIAREVLTNYGIAALIIVSVLGFCGWIIHRVLNYFMENLSAKEKQIENMGEKFSSRLEENTHAITNSTTVTKSLCEWLNREAKQNNDDHSEILREIRAHRAS